MGLHVVVSDLNPLAPGFAIADDTIVASTYDVQATVAAAQNYHENIRAIDGVICIATDVPLTVASVADVLGLPGIPVSAARVVSEKMMMKDCFKAANIPIPDYAELLSFAELRDIVSSWGFPLVIKPVDNRGARGVLRLQPSIDLAWAFEYAHGYSPSGRVMVEKFLDGPQVSTESIVIDGNAYTPGFSDRNYELLETYAPHIIENGGDIPGILSDDDRQKIYVLVEEAAAAIGISNGVIKGDVVVHEDQPYIIEVAARLSGGYFCSHEIPLSTGVDFVGQAIKLALGKTINPEDLRPKFNQPVSQRYLFPKPGKVKSISGAEEVAAQANIDLCELRVKEGDIIGEIDNHPARAGVVIAYGDTAQEAQTAAESAVAMIQIQTEPV